MHEGKQHGLSDCWQEAMNYDLVIIPDAGSNDYQYHKALSETGCDIIILDHHLVDKISEYAIIINNQTCDYPNKELSGVGVTWQFCRYLDSLLGGDYANELLDLVAIGNCGDMMSLRSHETKYLIAKGMKRDNIKNPFIDYMADKNSYSLNKGDYKPYDYSLAMTPMGAAFFIVPFVNAITRSGTIDEKKLIFKSMLTHEAFVKVPSTKRGHKAGEMETIVMQALRTATNVKNRQTRAEEAGMALLEELIEVNDMANEKILLFLLEPGEIKAEIRGLCANKMMARYQRPVCVLTKGENSYDGSMRGYTKNGLESFKEACEHCRGVNYVAGHDNAAGLGLQSDKIDEFMEDITNYMSNISSEPIYRIDYAFTEHEINPQRIFDIGSMNDYWGQDIDRAYVSMKFKVTSDNFRVLKSNTLQFSPGGGVTIMKFGGTEEEIEEFTIKTNGYKEVLAYCKCNVNEWQGMESPQLIMESYEIIDSCKFYF